MSASAVIQEVYQRMLTGWNEQNADTFAAPFADDGIAIGFDGSGMYGRAEISATLQQIFSEHVTARYVSKIKSVQPLSADVVMLRAIVGMAPPGQTAVNPAVNAHQTIIAIQRHDAWQIALLQTTPASFHGRPDLVAQMTEELEQIPTK